VAIGPEFQVNTDTTDDQFAPAVAADGTGNFVIMWTDKASGYRIFAQRYASSGAALGPEFQANVVNGARFPKVAAADAGDFVVVWERLGAAADGSYRGVFGRRFSSAGVALAPEFQVNTFTTSNQDSAALAADGAGNFVVVWQSNGQDGSGRGIFAQRYDAAGAALGGEFQVNTYTTSDQSYPDVAVAPMGDFLVTWVGSGLEAGVPGYGVFGQLYDSTGAAVGAQFLINTYTTSSQYNAAVSAGADGDFVVVWQSSGQDGAGAGIFGQRLASSGTPLGGEFQVNTYTTGGQSAPTAAAGGSGSFVVLWQSSEGDGHWFGVFGQHYDDTGTPMGGEFQVNTYTTGDQSSPAVAVDAAGKMMAVWVSNDRNAITGQDGSAAGVFGQRFSAGAQPMPIGGTKLLLRDDGDPSQRQIVFRTKDPILDTSTGSGLDPVADGASFLVYNPATGEAACFVLPAAAWQTLGPASGPTFAYRDVTSANGPCRSVRVKDGKLLKATCRAVLQPIPYSLDEPAQGGLAVLFSSGGTGYCTAFANPVIDTAGRFLGKSTAAPIWCPTAPISCP
jgi:hypothetical protein